MAASDAIARGQAAPESIAARLRPTASKQVPATVKDRARVALDALKSRKAPGLSEEAPLAPAPLTTIGPSDGAPTDSNEACPQESASPRRGLEIEVGRPPSRPRSQVRAAQPAQRLHDWRRALLSEDGPTPAVARLVALALAQDMNANTLETFAGAERIARVTGLSERAVRKHLQGLTQQGWLTEKTASLGKAHWRKVRRAALPAEVAERGAATDEREVPERGAGTGEAERGAATCGQLPEVAANDDASGGKSLHGDPAPSAGYLVDLSRSDLGAPDPAPAAAGSGARSGKAPVTVSPAELEAKVRVLIAGSQDDASVAIQLRQYGMTADRVQAIRAGMAAP